MRLTDDLFLQIDRGDTNPRDLLTDEELRQRCSDTNDMRHLLPVLYAACVGLNAKNVLEIGTNDGTSTLAFLKAAYETGGHVTSIDIIDEPHARGIVEALDLGARWTFIIGDSHEVLPRLRAEGRTFDVILIDGDHSYEGAKKDIQDCAAMLATGGLLLFHDSNMLCDADAPACGYAALELHGDPDWRGIILPFGSDLSIFQRRSDGVGRIEKHTTAQPFPVPGRGA